mgnify:CR=1 FL=1
MAKGKTPKPIRGPFDKRLIQEYKDMKRLADEKGGQYQKNLEVSYEPRSTLSRRLARKRTAEEIMESSGVDQKTAESIVEKMNEINPYAGQGYKNMGEAVGDFVEGATYLPRTAYYGMKDVISNLRGKDVGEFTPGTTRTPTPYMFDAGEGAAFQRRDELRTGATEYPEKIQYKKGGKVRGAGIARKGIRQCKMVKAK